MTLCAIILTGGPSRRMGKDKAALDWGGRSAVARLADVARVAGAQCVATVGGRDYGLPSMPDRAPDGGPVVGIMAGARFGRDAGCDRLLVLAVDAPTLLPSDIATLLCSASPGAAYERLNLPFVADLAALPQDAGPGWPVARVLDRAGLIRLPPPADAVMRLRGANTPQEREALLAELSKAEPAEKGGAR